MSCFYHQTHNSVEVFHISAALFGMPRFLFPSTVICNIFLVVSSLCRLCTYPIHLKCHPPLILHFHSITVFFYLHNYFHPVFCLPLLLVPGIGASDILISMFLLPLHVQHFSYDVIHSYVRAWLLGRAVANLLTQYCKHEV